MVITKLDEASQLNAENTENTGSTENVSVYATAVKLTNFYHDVPVFWFAQVESQFSVKSITVDETKFHYVVAALPQEVALCVMPAVESGAYETLKMALLGMFDLR